VALVIHADPPAEHKAYLHRSGRTARAGASGTVVTLMTEDQVADVRDLTRQAGINPTITPLRPGDALLAELAPGERLFTAPPGPRPASSSGSTGVGSAGSGSARGASARGGSAGGGSAGGGAGRGGSARRGTKRDASPHNAAEKRQSSRVAADHGGSARPARVAAAPAGAGGAAAFSAGSRVGSRGRR
jgi:superfamily II DNA/RNA helicase